MIISKAVAVQQANSLLHLYNYRKLKICTMEETEIVLAGSILINRSAKGFQRILGKNCYSDRIRKTPLRIGCRQSY